MRQRGVIVYYFVDILNDIFFRSIGEIDLQTPRYIPMENMLSRSWRECTRKAISVSDLMIPSTLSI